ncbi:MAG: transcription antitermination factor NusB [Christensenellales bacterium]|nr:transcription antitermination factor NusB [Clostridia bacterium]
MRKYAREVAFSLVFEYMFTKTFNEMELEQFKKENLTEDDLDFIKKLYKGVVGEYSDLENRVGELSKGFKIDRVFKVDKAVLMMAVFELDNLDTPKSVVINEAVELAKKFSTEFSANFVNGVLGAYAKD